MIENKNKKILVISIYAGPLFGINNDYLNKFYSDIKELEKNFILIILTELSNSDAVELAKKINLKFGYIVAGYGSSIYDSKKEIFHDLDPIDYEKSHFLIRQTLVNGDSLFIFTNKSNYGYFNNISLYKGIMNNHHNDIILIDSYDVLLNKIKTLNVNHFKIYFTSWNIDFLKNRVANIKNIVDRAGLKSININDEYLIVTNKDINNTLNYIFNLLKIEEPKYILLNLTSIFKSEKLNNVAKEIDAPFFVDQLYLDKTFHLFEKEFSDLIDKNKDLFN